MSGLCIRPKKDLVRAFKFGNKSNISMMNQNRTMLGKVAFPRDLLNSNSTVTSVSWHSICSSLMTPCSSKAVDGVMLIVVLSKDSLHCFD